MSKIDPRRNLDHIVAVTIGQATKLDELRSGYQKYVCWRNREVGIVDQIDSAGLPNRIVAIAAGKLKAAVSPIIELLSVPTWLPIRPL